MHDRDRKQRAADMPANRRHDTGRRVIALPGVTPTFQERFADVFAAGFPRLYRYLDRLSGDPDLAADLAQEAFVRLYRRGSLPDTPAAWLAAVAMNLLRNTRSMRSRRRRLVDRAHSEFTHPAPPRTPEAEAMRSELQQHVRAAIDALPERQRHLLLMHAEGYSYRDIASGLELNEASIGTLLARARREFRAIYEAEHDAR